MPHASPATVRALHALRTPQPLRPREPRTAPRATQGHAQPHPGSASDPRPKTPACREHAAEPAKSECDGCLCLPALRCPRDRAPCDATDGRACLPAAPQRTRTVSTCEGTLAFSWDDRMHRTNRMLCMRCTITALPDRGERDPLGCTSSFPTRPYVSYGFDGGGGQPANEAAVPSASHPTNANRLSPR